MEAALWLLLGWGGCGSPAPVGGLKSYFDALRARARSCSGFPWSHSVS